jgi:hypothetical protein
MLLNYSTSIAVDKTVGEIHAKLAKAGAHQILNEYKTGIVSAVSFRIETRFGDVAFRLPVRIEAVEEILRRQFRRGKFTKTDQASRVGWRIIKDWVEAQLALIETGMVTVEQVFLPYAQNASGITLYEALKEKRFSGYALPAPKGE